MPKTVMLDGLNLALDKGTGVSTYARNLSYELHEMGHNVDVLYGVDGYNGWDKLLSEMAFFDPFHPNRWIDRIMRAIHDYGAALRPVYPKKVPLSGRVVSKTFKSRMPYYDNLWNARNVFDVGAYKFAVTRRFKPVHIRGSIDLMHWTYPLPLRTIGVPNIYTLHDLVPLKLPYTTLDNNFLYLRLMQRIVRSADAIVTVSENSKKDIIELLKCPEHKVINTYQSVNIPAKYRDRPDEDIKREVEGVFGLPYKDYFIFFGSIEPKKNIGRLIEAYLSSKIEAPLVVVGAQAWKSEQELRLINPASNSYLEQIGNITKSRDRIRQFGYASFPLLVSLIRGAKGVVFPSLYEGFGLPILESMQLGTPVITSTEGSAPEVAGDAAILVDPYDPRAIAQAMVEIDENEELRKTLSAKGRKRAAKFSPEAHRERLGAVYDRFLK